MLLEWVIDVNKQEPFVTTQPCTTVEKVFVDRIWLNTFVNAMLFNNTVDDLKKKL